ncbi:non-ribosomal peptide synthetase family protein [Streptomyces roseolilacinus]|uniref:non-ribosomal peptide synthetase family protein n=1 Tax=Streptomyces roseolilacinus TaxID=66904 RepID=UPI00382B805B
MTDLDFTTWDLRTEREVRSASAVLTGPEPDWDYETTLAALVLDQAARTPAAVAVRLGEQQLTYAELIGRAGAVASWVAALPAERPLVGVVGHRGLPVYPVLLGVLLAGGAYVPLDPDSPPSRQRAVAERAGVAAVVTDAEGWARLALPGTRALITDEVLPFQRARLLRGDLVEYGELPEATDPNESGGSGGSGSPVARGSGPRPHDLAYVIFTSGSTGTPKGVQIEHRSAVNLVRWVQHTTGMGPGSRVTQNASLHFDASVQQIFSAWSCGATLLPVPEAVRVDGARLHAWLVQEGVTHWDSVPSLWRPVVELCARRIAAGERVLPALRALILAGETLPGDLVNQWRPWEQGHRLFNVYGPTEVTVDATAHEVTAPVEGVAPPIGRPLPGITAAVLDAQGHPCPVHADGELHLSGVGLARGYLADPELTGQRFVTRDGTRWYRTGDLVRRTGDGELLFTGRRDDQLKVNGVRVEPVEVETALRSFPEVTDAIAFAAPADGGRTTLAACVVTAVPVSTAALRTSLFDVLPAAMVPSRLLVVDSLPRTASGKTDRRACADLMGDLPPDVEGDTDTQVVTGTARRLLDLWRQVLGHAGLGPDDDFFRSGGDSIATIRLRQRCAEAGLPIQAMDVFAHPTVRRLAHHLDRTRALTAPPRHPAEAPGYDASMPLPLLPAQRSLALTALLSGKEQQPGLVQETHFYDEVLDLEALRGALDLLTERHELLRMGVLDLADGLQQVPGADAVIHLAHHDLGRSARDQQQEAVRAVGDAELRAGFDLAGPPLLRVCSFDLGAHGFALTWTLHHVVSDGWSWELVQREFEAVYAALRANRFRPLPPVPLSLRDLIGGLQRLRPPQPSPEWLAALHAVEPLALPPGPLEAQAARQYDEWELPARADRALRHIAVAEGCTLSAVHLLVFAEALGRVCRQSDFPVAVVSSGRNVDLPGIDGAVACLARSMPVPVRLDGAPTERLGLLHHGLAAVVEQDAADPDEVLGGLPAPVRSPVATFVFQNYPDAPGSSAPGTAPLRRAPVPVVWRETGAEPIALVCHEGPDGGLRCRLEHDPGAVSRNTAQLLAREIRRIQLHLTDRGLS